MIDRRVLGEIPPKPHTVFKRPQGLASEFVLTRDGFSGGFSLLYQADAPTAVVGNAFWKGDASRLLGVAVPNSEIPLARRHVQTWKAPAGQNLIDSRTALWRHETCRVSVVRGRLTGGDFAFTNADGDELWFFKEGSGALLTMFGRLDFAPNDYVLIPRGIPYVIEHKGDIEAFLIEGDPGIGIPAEFRNPHGQLKLEAPYTHRDFRSPSQLLSAQDAQRFARILTLRNSVVSEHHYVRSPSQTIGWDGSVYPVAFSILDYLPKTGKIHLPPNLHTTFTSKQFVVCSFVPRMVDYAEGAIPCPYPHANVNCEELLYYVRGNFTSRKGIQEKSVSWHPVGMPHGPHPGNYFGSVGHKSTDELAVMLDTWFPLAITRAALEIEDPGYPLSWKPD